MKKSFRAIAGFWRRFSLAERHQLVGAACFLIVLCYGLLLWYPGQKKMSTLIYQEQKQSVRLRAAAKSQAALKGFNMDGMDIQTTQRDLATVRESSDAMEAERKRLEARFTSLDDLEAVQALKSELTRLAESGDMEVTALEHIYPSREGKDLPPTPELLKAASEGNRYRRPLLNLKARASYWGLMAFLDGLSSLSRIAAPVWSSISVKTGKVKRTGTFGVNEVPLQWLEVEIHLAI